MGHICIGTIYVDAVDFQKGQHNIHTDTFVAVYKCTIGNQRISQLSTFLFLAWIELSITKSCKGCFQSRFQQCFIADTNATTKALQV